MNVRDAPGSRAREMLLDGTSGAPDALALFAEASTRLRPLIPFDAAVWRATDPETGLMTAPIRVENLDDDGCAVYWDCELLSENLNLFQDLARAPLPAAGLRATAGGTLGRSALHRRFLRPRGLDDELRAVLRADDAPWGHVSLLRRRGREPFTADEVAFVASLSAPLARQLRTFAGPGPDVGAATVDGLGVLLFDATGALVSINDEARAHLEAMPPGPGTATALGVVVPAWLRSTAVRAVAIAQGRDRGAARIRARTLTGRWLVCHASCLRAVDGSPESTVVVLEPAASSEVAALVVAAYGLSARELEITQEICRGFATSEIARRLFISPHTVRDHVKAIFEKTGVSTRGELVARLLFEQHEPLSAGRVERLEVA